MVLTQCAVEGIYYQMNAAPISKEGHWKLLREKKEGKESMKLRISRGGRGKISNKTKYPFDIST